jgi:hypothetical protein
VISARKPSISLVALKSICIFMANDICTLVIHVERNLRDILNLKDI